MIKKVEFDVDVVTMAQRRIINVFKSSNRIALCLSGGKDSICINDLLFKLCQSGQIDKSKLQIVFIDEEAIYPCVERVVKNIRLQWLSIGVPFNWYCLQVKHYCCLNQLMNDESFICWDETKKDVWIRERPLFAITKDDCLKERKETYQDFLDRKYKYVTRITGVRVAESNQRMKAFSKKKNLDDKIQPIYDWSDKDVWKYIYDNNLEIPDAYMYMYQVGLGKNRMRISQFFSVDTIGNLVQMCEFYPDLYDKICKREPNAYMVSLYYDTEMYRRTKTKSSGANEDTDYQKKLKEVLAEEWRFQSKNQKQNRQVILNMLYQFGHDLTNKDYRDFYQIVIAGDPKKRSLRALYTTIGSRRKKEFK